MLMNFWNNKYRMSVINKNKSKTSKKDFNKNKSKLNK